MNEMFEEIERADNYAAKLRRESKGETFLEAIDDTIYYFKPIEGESIGFSALVYESLLKHRRRFEKKLIW